MSVSLLFQEVFVNPYDHKQRMCFVRVYVILLECVIACTDTVTEL